MLVNNWLGGFHIPVKRMEVVLPRGTSGEIIGVMGANWNIGDYGPH